MASALHRLVEGFPANPSNSGKLLQRLLLDSPEQFFQDSLPLLRAAPDTQAFYYVLALLHSRNLILRNVCDPALFTKSESVALAKRMGRVEPLFDIKLTKMLLANEGLAPGAEPEQACAGIRLLEVIAETSDRGRSLLLAQLLNHASPQVRSKAALLMGKSNKDVKWVSRRMREPDSRVRANAVEALWRVESEDCRQVFESALDDPANRVVGNALLGLYLLGASAAIGLILKMVAHQDQGFRRTAIWVMGETGDLRFLDALSGLMKDSEPPLRPYAFRAFAKLKQKRSRLAALPALWLHAFNRETRPGGWKEMRVAAVSPSGPVLGLKPTQFALWENSELVLDYNVTPMVEKEPLMIALAFASDAGIQREGLENCFRFQRKGDSGLVLPYCAELDSAGVADQLLASVANSNGKRHLVLLGRESLNAPSAKVHEIADAARLADVTMHVVDTRSVAEDSMPEFLASLCAGLTASYQVRYRNEGGVQDLEIEVCTEQGLGEASLPAKP
jgi:hypothetical protein